jgi:hypothetical protein
MLTFNPDEGIVEITGKASQWVGPSPEDLGVDLGSGVKNGKEIVPFIRNRRLKA